MLRQTPVDGPDGDGGFSITELLIAGFVASLISAAFGSVMIAVLGETRAVAGTTAATTDGRTALEVLGRELREADRRADLFDGESTPAHRFTVIEELAADRIAYWSDDDPLAPGATLVEVRHGSCADGMCTLERRESTFGLNGASWEWISTGTWAATVGADVVQGTTSFVGLAGGTEVTACSPTTTPCDGLDVVRVTLHVPTRPGESNPRPVEVSEEVQVRNE